MLSTIKGIFTSKKFIMAVIGSAVVAALQQFSVPNEIIVMIASFFGITILGQGLSDFGKNKPQ